MTSNGWIQILLFLAAVAAVTVPLGAYMARVFGRERTWLDPVLRPVERLIYRLTGVDETREMRWTEYGLAMLAFSLVSMQLPLRFQGPFDDVKFNPDVSEGVASLLTPIELGREGDSDCAPPPSLSAGK